MRSRLKEPQSCIVCARRSMGLAAGWSWALGWYCKACGVNLARKAMSMKGEHMDAVERRACEMIAEGFAEGEDVIIPRDQLADFISWCVDEFGKNMRKVVSEGR